MLFIWSMVFLIILYIFTLRDVILYRIYRFIYEYGLKAKLKLFMLFFSVLSLDQLFYLLLFTIF